MSGMRPCSQRSSQFPRGGPASHGTRHRHVDGDRRHRARGAGGCRRGANLECGPQPHGRADAGGRGAPRRPRRGGLRPRRRVRGHRPRRLHRRPGRHQRGEGPSPRVGRDARRRWHHVDRGLAIRRTRAAHPPHHGRGPRRALRGALRPHGRRPRRDVAAGAADHRGADRGDSRDDPLLRPEPVRRAGAARRGAGRPGTLPRPGRGGGGGRPPSARSAGSACSGAKRSATPARRRSTRGRPRSRPPTPPRRRAATQNRESSRRARHPIDWRNR